MSRTGRTNRNRNASRSATPKAVREIAAQLARLSDEDVFALTYSADRATRRVADQLAHERAERYALNH